MKYLQVVARQMFLGAEMISNMFTVTMAGDFDNNNEEIIIICLQVSTNARVIKRADGNPHDLIRPGMGQGVYLMSALLLCEFK